MDGRWGDKYLPEFVVFAHHPRTLLSERYVMFPHTTFYGSTVVAEMAAAYNAAKLADVFGQECASVRIQTRTPFTQKKSPSMECYLSINPITTLIEQTKNRAHPDDTQCYTSWFLTCSL